MTMIPKRSTFDKMRGKVFISKDSSVWLYRYTVWNEQGHAHDVCMTLWGARRVARRLEYSGDDDVVWVVS